MPEKILEICVLAYLLGSIPFGLLLTRAAGLGDVRAIGSGNIGATNVMRTGRKGLGILTLLLDAGKGYAAVWIADGLDPQRHFPPYFIFIAGLAVVLGHIFPIWLKFKGGKGVATAIGVMLGIVPIAGLSIMLWWAILFARTRISAVAALGSFALNCITAYVFGGKEACAFMLALSMILLYTHRSNIRRLREGKEHHFKEKAS